MEVRLADSGKNSIYQDQLMYLPLELSVSDYVLRRRGAISFGSSSVFASQPRLEVSSDPYIISQSQLLIHFLSYKPNCSV